MTPRPPTSPLFPYTTLFRSFVPLLAFRDRELLGCGNGAGLVRERGRVLAGMARAPVSANPNDFEKQDRKSTRLNSSHSQISYAVFCLKKKNKNIDNDQYIYT